MRMLVILLLLAALGAGGFLTRPDEAAQKKHADEVLSKSSGDVIGDLVGSLIGGKPSEEFQDMFVATKYTRRAGDKVLIECTGVFGQFLCSQPEKK